MNEEERVAPLVPVREKNIQDTHGFPSRALEKTKQNKKKSYDYGMETIPKSAPLGNLQFT